MWSVVCFMNENTVAAVPSYWFRDGYCAWPNKFVRKSIERRKSPNELEFTSYKAKILHTDISNDLFYYEINFYIKSGILNCYNYQN